LTDQAKGKAEIERILWRMANKKRSAISMEEIEREAQIDQYLR